MELSDTDELATGMDQNEETHMRIDDIDKEKKLQAKWVVNKEIIAEDDNNNDNERQLNHQNKKQQQTQYHQHNLQNQQQQISAFKKNDKNFISCHNKSSTIQQHEGQYQQQQQQKHQKGTLQTHQQQTVVQLQAHQFQLIEANVQVPLQQFRHQQYDSKENNLQDTHYQQNIKLLQTQYSYQPQIITQFSPQHKSPTITINQPQSNEAEQNKYYFENQKLILTQQIQSIDSTVTFRIDNLKYCVGVGVALKEVIQKHSFDYKSTTNNQLGHGLYLLTSQGYTWSHSELEEDDIFRGNQWKALYTGANIIVTLKGEQLTFKFKKSSFSMTLPSRIRQKYTLSFCAYLHQKTDAVSIVS